MSDKQNQENLTRSDELSLRSLFLKTGEYLSWFIRFWYIPILFALAFGIYSYYQISLLKSVYPGEIKLLVKVQDIAKESKNKILIYSRFTNSDKIIGEMLLERVLDDQDSELIANFYLQTYEKHLPEGLPEGVKTGFRFEHNEPSLFSDEEKLAYRNIVKRVTGKEKHYSGGYINVNVDENLGIITLITATPAEELTFLLLNRLKQKFELITLDNAAYSERNSYEAFQVESDTLEQHYREVYYDLLKYKERYQLFLKKMEETDGKMRRLQKIIAQKEIEADIYKSKYLVTLQHLKASQNNMNIRVPIIEVLSESLPPLEAHKPNALKRGIKNAIIGAVCALVLLMLVKLFRDIMQEG